MRGWVSVHRCSGRLTRLFHEGMSVWLARSRGCAWFGSRFLSWCSSEQKLILLISAFLETYWGLQCVVPRIQTLILNYQQDCIALTNEHFIFLHGCWFCQVADVIMLSYLCYLDVHKLHVLPVLMHFSAVQSVRGHSCPFLCVVCLNMCHSNYIVHCHILSSREGSFWRVQVA